MPALTHSTATCQGYMRASPTRPPLRRREKTATQFYPHHSFTRTLHSHPDFSRKTTRHPRTLESENFRASACLLCDLFSVPCKRNYAPKMKMLGDSHAHPHICPSRIRFWGKQPDSLGHSLQGHARSAAVFLRSIFCIFLSSCIEAASLGLDLERKAFGMIFICDKSEASGEGDGADKKSSKGSLGNLSYAISSGVSLHLRELEPSGGFNFEFKLTVVILNASDSHL